MVNMIDTQILRQYLDAINFNIQDNDLILLNQLSSIKGLANRKAFSLSEQQLSMIHIKFKNLYEQRKENKDTMPQGQMPNRRQSYPKAGFRDTLIMPQKSDIDHRYQPVHVKSGRRNNEVLPRELQFHELEESREYREGGYKPHRVKSKPMYGSAFERYPQ